MGGKGGATNPEQLFAAGYAACFGNAVIHATRKEEVKVRDNDVEVTATVGIGPNDSGGFGLTVALDVTLAGVDQITAEKIVTAAHEVCPYSNATRGNVDVKLSVFTR
jgi:Ohr subfamily peroxiredoxin